jgi:hypothetical protein|tara:strand:+ start:432 stop:689 length:258 start_codon:yes stop_codon:yes gene_type:complete
MIFLVAYFYAGLVNPEFVTCQLAKRTKIQGEMVCIYKGPNNTIGYHYPSFSFKECPRQFQCRYSPNVKRRPTVKEIMEGLQGGFE